MRRFGIAPMIVAVSSVLVSGCSPSPAPRDVAYFRSHAEDRQRQLSICANDPGARGAQTECVNAREAERLEGVGSLRSLAPLGLPVSRTPAEN